MIGESMGMQEMMEKAVKGMDSMPKCDNCGNHQQEEH